MTPIFSDWLMKVISKILKSWGFTTFGPVSLNPWGWKNHIVGYFFSHHTSKYAWSNITGLEGMVLPKLKQLFYLRYLPRLGSFNSNSEVQAFFTKLPRAFNLIFAKVIYFLLGNQAQQNQSELNLHVSTSSCPYYLLLLLRQLRIFTFL